MSRLLDSGLEQLTVLVYRMGEVAENVVRRFINGFVEGKDVTEDVQDMSEVLVSMTSEVEDKAFELIVKYQPVASDLRIINSYMKIGYDFGRYGRYAWDISSTHKKLTGLGKCIESDSSSIETLSAKVLEMVHRSVSALKDHDVELAKTLAGIEKQVDNLYFKYLDQLAKFSTETKNAVCNLLVARFLERIADHTTYVGESVIYIVTGQKLVLR